MTNVDDTLPGRLLGVWPHPDDEAYLSTGLMGRITDARGDVTVLTVTSGERGTADPAELGSPRFARRREQELEACLATVGVDDLILFGLADGGCAEFAAEVVVAAIEAVIDRKRPDTIVTFGPDGITGHPDHLAVSRWTTEAWQRAGTGELLYATMADSFLDRHADLHAEIGLFDEFGADGTGGCPDHEIALAVDLTEPELDRKRAALAAHASQTAALAAHMGEDRYRSWWRTETFRRPRPSELSSATGVRPGRHGVLS